MVFLERNRSNKISEYLSYSTTGWITTIKIYHKRDTLANSIITLRLNTIYFNHWRIIRWFKLICVGSDVTKPTQKHLKLNFWSFWITRFFLKNQVIYFCSKPIIFCPEVKSRSKLTNRTSDFAFGIHSKQSGSVREWALQTCFLQLRHEKRVWTRLSCWNAQSFLFL